MEDYDPGLLNDWGGGNVSWWQDYIRAEIDRANDFWREQIEAAQQQRATDGANKCPKCAYSNMAGAPECEMCGTPLPRR